jgi:hypothetical protein
MGLSGWLFVPCQTDHIGMFSGFRDELKIPEDDPLEVT